MVAIHEKYVYLFIEPREVNVLEGFVTQLAVMGVPRDTPNAPENVTRYVNLENASLATVSKEPPCEVTIVGRNPADTAFLVKGTTPRAAPAKLVARPIENSGIPANLEAWAEVWVDESDLLVYAPDGLIYWLPTKKWMCATTLDPKNPEDLKRLREVIPLLKNEAVVANIPHSASDEAPRPAEQALPRAGAEPVTCFLLNLNSILMSYTPSKSLKEGQQDGTPFTEGALRPPPSTKT